MAGKIFKKIALFQGFLLTICVVLGQELLNSNEADARRFLSQISDRMFKIFDELVDKDYHIDVDVHHGRYTPNPNYIVFVNKIVNDSKKFDFENFRDQELKYAFEVLVQIADLNIIGTERYSEILESLKKLEFLSYYKDIYKYDPRNAHLSYAFDVLDIIKKSNDEGEIQHYWSEWRRITGDWAKRNLIMMIEGIKDAAKLSGMTPLDFWSRGFNISDMEHMMRQIRPLYSELHAFIRYYLRKRFGKSTIVRDRLIPAHIFEQISYQILTNDSIIEEIYPFDNLPPVDEEIRKTFNPNELYRIAEEFYACLGFERYSNDFWRDRINLRTEEGEDDYDKKDIDDDDNYYDEEDAEKDIDDDDEDDDVEEVDECQIRVYYKTPNIYLKYCKNMTFLDFLDSFINMGYIHYAKEMVGLPAYFFGSPQNLDDAIGKAVVLSVFSQSYLKKIEVIPDIDIPKNVELNRLLRTALRRILYLPVEFVHAKVISDLLSEKVEIKNLNNYYWNNMIKYAGIKKPHWHDATNTFDFSETFYKDMNENLMSRKFTTDILSYQIFQKLCELSKNIFGKFLHRCDISGSLEVGNALKKMMQLGKSKPFEKVLATIFPNSPKLSAAALLEYYKPVKNVLSRKNRKLNVRPGWDITTSMADELL